MAQNTSGISDFLGENFPWLAYTGARALRAIPSLMGRSAGLLGGAPGLAAATAASILQPTPANAGEKDLYVRGPDGNWIPNPALSAPKPQGASGAGPVAATPSPSPLPAAPGSPPAFNPLFAPLLSGSTAGGFTSGGGASKPVFDPPLPQSKPWVDPDTTRTPNLYNGPGSMSFGAGDQAPGGGVGSLAGLFKGGLDASNSIQRAPNAPFWNIVRMLSNNGQAFAPGWKASNAWYNK